MHSKERVSRRERSSVSNALERLGKIVTKVIIEFGKNGFRGEEEVGADHSIWNGGR